MCFQFRIFRNHELGLMFDDINFIFKTDGVFLAEGQLRVCGVCGGTLFCFLKKAR